LATPACANVIFRVVSIKCCLYLCLN